DHPSIEELAQPGKLSIIDLSAIDNQKKKQLIVSYFARRLFSARKKDRIPPFLLLIEESHNFARERASKSDMISKSIIETIAREGRKFGASLCLVSQRPVQLSTTALSQCNTNIIMRVTNPFDIDHIGESCEGIDKAMLGSITTLRVGEALVVGEAVNNPIFVKVRKRKSKKSPKGESLESLARRFDELEEKKKQDVEAFL
ncbi:MAG: ATP-binding protein, partial [Candidatus Micrarchaeota archaeon]